MVYSIDSIEVPSNVVRSIELENNARGRVIALSSILEHHFGVTGPKVVCIADADMNSLLGIPRTNGYLAYTDFTGLEMYLYDANVLSKFLDLYVRNRTQSPEELFETMAPVLEELFLIRLCNEVLQLGMSHLSFERCCTVTGGKVTFDREDYLTRYLSKGQALGQREQFIQCIEEHRARLGQEPRNQMHGHDFLALLAYMLRRQVNDKALVRPGTFERTLFSCLEIGDIARYPLFQALHARLG